MDNYNWDRSEKQFFLWKKQLKERGAVGADSLAESTTNTPNFIWPICPICPKVWDIVEKRLHQASVVRLQRHSTFLSDCHALKNGRTIDVKITCNAYFFLAGAHCTGLVQLSAAVGAAGAASAAAVCSLLSSIKMVSGCCRSKLGIPSTIKYYTLAHEMCFFCLK